MKRRIRKVIIALFVTPLLPLSLLLYFCGYRRLIIFTGRIGHLAVEPDVLLKAEVLGLIKSKRWLVVAPYSQVANQHLLNYWKKYFTIFQSPIVCLIIRSLTFWRFTQYDASYFINSEHGAQYGYEVYAKWGLSRQPLLTLTSEDEVFGNKKLLELGLPQGAWFVCVHAREGGFSPHDEHIHSYRNGKIQNLLPAMEEIIQRGGWVIRLGDPTTQPLESMPHVIDYAHHPLRDPRLDIILCAKARFILGNTSGIFLVGSIFGTPSVLVNMVPFAALGMYEEDISIPKLYRSIRNNHYLTFNEIIDKGIANYRHAHLYQNLPISVEENSPEDISAVTKEMFDRLDGSFIQTPQDKERHKKYMSLFSSDHYSYGTKSNIGRDFLRKYEYLLSD